MELRDYIDSHILCRCPIELRTAVQGSEAYLEMHEIALKGDNEIMEYYLVSSSLGQRLALLEEPVMELSTCFIWGRTCTNIALSDDTTLQAIFASL